MSDLGFLEEEIKAVMEEISNYSACDKKYTDALDNLMKLESTKLSREKFNLDYEERLQRLALEKQQAVLEHEEKMEQIKSDKKDSTNKLLGTIGTCTTVAFGAVVMVNAEQTHVISSKVLNWLLKLIKI